MKKMNFTPLLTSFFALLLPMFLLMSSTTVMADNGKNAHKNSSTHKKSAMLVVSTFVSQNVVNCPAVNTTLGSATVRITSVSQVGTTTQVIIYENGLPVVPSGFVLSGGISAATPLTLTFGGITSANLTFPNPITRTFTARVLVRDLATGSTVEVQELGPVVVANGPLDLVAPVIGGPNAFAFAGCPGGLTPVSAALLGQTPITDDCSGVNPALTFVATAAAPLVPIVNVPFGVSNLVVSATDFAGRTRVKPVTVTVSDIIAPTIAVTVNGAVIQCGTALNLTVDPITGVTAPITVSATATDNCPGALVATQTQGPATGATLAPGTYTITFTAPADASGNVAAPCSITVFVGIDQRCVEKVSKVIQTAGCLIQVMYTDLVAPGATLPTGVVTIRKPNVLLYRGVLPFTLASPFVQGGDELEVMHTLPGGAMCVTYIRLIDNEAPTVQPLVPIINATIRCTELVNGKAPIPGAIILGNSLTQTRMPEPISGDVSVALIPVATLTNPIWTMTPAGATPARRVFGVIDCSFFYASYEDIITAAIFCNGEIIPTSITRRFRFKDRFGNESFADQIITVIRPDIQFPAIAVNRTDCSASIASLGLPFIDWNENGVKDTGEEILPDTDYCGRKVILASSTQMETCPGSIMVMREWKIIDCGNFRAFSQNFTLQDMTGPQAVVSYKDNSRVPEVMCTYMVRELADGRMDTLPMQSFVYKTVNENVTKTIKATDAERIIKITPLVRLESCNPLIGDIDFTLTPSDPTCSNGKVSVFANVGNVSFNGMPSMSVAGGTVIRVRGKFQSPVMGTFDDSFTIFMVDPCGNVTTIKVIVVLVDNIGPNVICEDKEVSLNTAGEAVIRENVFSGGTSDNCPRLGITTLLKLKGSSCYSDRVILRCNNRGFDSVDVRVIDMMGNYTDCCVRINVRDKFAPTCPMSPDITTVCTDPLLQNVNAMFTQPIPYDNCETPRVRSEPVTLALTCGAGEVVKTWTFTDSYGNSVSCNQRLVVTAVLGYGVTTLASETVACLPTESDDRAAILRSLLHRRSSADNTATCSAPILKITEMVHSSTEYCKRIMRTYELIDLCNTTGGTALELGEIAAGGASTVYAPASGIIRWSRTITVVDRTPPTVRVEPEQELCVTDNSCASNFPTITLSATDACAAINIPPGGTTTPNSYSYLYYRYEVRRGSLTGEVITSAAGNGLLTTAPNGFLVTATATNNLRNLPLGVYFLLYVVVDDCGNVAQGTPIRVVIKDCKSPYINTHDKNTALAYVSGNGGAGQGMSQVCISDVLNSINDNCTPFTTLSGAIATYGMKMERADRALTGVNGTDYRNAPNQQCIMFGCSDLALSPIAVRIWAIDGAGNAVFNIAFITIEDNNRACSAPTPQSIVTGTLKTEGAQSAKAVTISASANGTIANTATTDANGAFNFNVNQTGNYIVKAAKTATDDKYAGVTTFDIARISKHLLDIEAFTSPYQHIAADVDKNGSIDGADMLHIRNFILRKSSSLPGGVWRFIDKNYTFRNPSNPFGEDFAEVVNVANAKANESVNFVAAKLGDVNGTYSANLVSTVVRNSNALTLNVEDKNLVAGNEYTVNVTAENFNAIAFQGTFGIANASIKSVKAGDLKNYSDGNFGIFASEITTSWNGQAHGATQVFSVTFTANKSGKLSDVMTVGNALTPAVANDATGAEMNINLKFSTGKVAGGEFALYQNTPNPVANETSIGFNMPKDGAAKLTIYNVEGKVVLNKNIDAKAGLNNVSISKNELSVSGVLYYRLETSEFSATKKMIIIE